MGCTKSPQNPQELQHMDKIIGTLRLMKVKNIMVTESDKSNNKYSMKFMLSYLCYVI